MAWGSDVAVSCGVGCRRVSDPTLLWLWRRPVATAPIRLLAWEPPYATGAAQEIAKRHTKKNLKIKKIIIIIIIIGVPVVAQSLTNPTRNHEVSDLILGLAWWVKDPALP